MANGKDRTIAVLGAASLVGEPLVRRLVAEGIDVLAYSRQARLATNDGVRWRVLASAPVEPVDCWISVAPLGVLPAYRPMIEASGARRLVQLSSTNRFTKLDSRDRAEATLVRRLIEGEVALQEWAEGCGIGWTVLRPTLIYAAGRDRNFTEIARFIRRFGFFPLFGKAEGLRQPVSARDVAEAAVLAAGAPIAINRAYNIAGSDVLTYREMVHRIFAAMGKRPRTPSVPLGLFRLALAGLHVIPRYRAWTPAMAERMNTDMVFDNTEATRDFGYAPGQFAPGPFP